MSTFIVETHEGTWRAPGSTRSRRAAAAGRQRRGEHRALRRAVRRRARRPRAGRQQLAVDQLRHRPQRALARTGTSSCSATPRTRRTSRSARAPSSRWRTRSRWRGRCRARRATSGARARGLRGRAPADRREHAARRAGVSLEWFEGIGRYVGQEPAQFAFNLLTRSRRITYDNLRLRDPEFVAGRRGSPTAGLPGGRRCSCRSGCAASSWPTASSSRRWTCTPRSTGPPGDFHLVHLGARALGGAGARDDRDDLRLRRRAGSRPGCGGLYRDDARRRLEADRRLRPRARATARIGAQLGHAGRKGSTKLMWEGIDEPLPDGNWPLIAPSPLPYSPDNQVPREMTRADMDAVRDEFVAAARGAAAARVRPARAAHGPRLPAVLVPLAADQRARRRVRRHARRTAPASRSRCSTPAARCGRRRSRCPCASRRPTGCPAASSADDAVALRADAARARLRHRRRLHRPGLARRAARLRAQLPDAVRRPDPQRGRDPRRSPSARSPATTTSTRSSLAGRADLCALGRAAPLRPALDAARRRRAGLRRSAVACSVSAGFAQTPQRTGR